MNSTDTDSIANLKIKDITIGSRSRQDLGDLSGLKESIQKVGLLHPVVVDSNNTLIAGRRRLEAFRQMGRQTIPCRVVTSFDNALKALQAETDENVERKSLTPLEAHALAKRLEPLQRKAAKERQAQAGKQHGRGKKPIASENFFFRLSILGSNFIEVPESD